ncbi:MAG: hypothetical protein IJX65_00430 [Alistipes sp.]|nr:hypothetical protein [Alistipes sp.]
MLIENPKTYKGSDAETIFFRPTFCGDNATELGIRVLYNMPMPTTVQVWSRAENVLQPFASGWNGGSNSQKLQKTIDMQKVKAETSFSADDYFSMVLEKLVADNGVNYQDLTGTELEKAETELFRQAIAEGVRSTMWIGDTSEEISELTTFNGFFRHIADAGDKVASTIAGDDEFTATEQLKGCWTQAADELRSLRSEGQLVYFVSSDIYNAYLDELDQKGVDTAYTDIVSGQGTLCYHGIPVVEVPLGNYTQACYSSFCLLTDRRNLVLALNTADMPENEVRMWYNPDQMENRQRAVFLAGAEIIDEKLISIYHSDH